MAIRINGDNTTAAPGITRGDDTDTGLQFGTDEVSVVTGGVERVKVDNVETVFTQPTGDAKVRIHAAENDSGSDAELIIETSNDFAESALIFNDSSGVGGSIRYNHGDNATRFLTNGTSERMRIDVDGKVHIGNDLGDKQAELFQVIRNGGGQGTNDCLVWFETGQNDWILKLNHTELPSGNAYFIDCMQQGTQRGKAWFDGSNMNWATSSDYRLKENVTPVTNGISEVKRLNPVNYNFIENPTVPQVGFLAHELDEVCPYAVGGEKDAVNDDGSIDPQMVDKSHVVPLLTAALKEAIAKIETLEAKVAALEAN